MIGAWAAFTAIDETGSLFDGIGLREWAACLSGVVIWLSLGCCAGVAADGAGGPSPLQQRSRPETKVLRGGWYPGTPTNTASSGVVARCSPASTSSRARSHG
jgi:hypothetical protein